LFTYLYVKLQKLKFKIHSGPWHSDHDVKLLKGWWAKWSGSRTYKCNKINYLKSFKLITDNFITISVVLLTTIINTRKTINELVALLPTKDLILLNDESSSWSFVLTGNYRVSVIGLFLGFDFIICTEQRSVWTNRTTNQTIKKINISRTNNLFTRVPQKQAVRVSEFTLNAHRSEKPF